MTPELEEAENLIMMLRQRCNWLNEQVRARDEKIKELKDAIAGNTAAQKPADEAPVVSSA